MSNTNTSPARKQALPGVKLRKTFTGKNAELNKQLFDLLDRLKNQDSKALTELMSLMNARFEREAFSYLKSKEEADEAVNSVYEKLWRKAGLFNNQRPPLPYVISVLRNHCRDVIRKKNRRIECISLDSSKRVIKIREQSPDCDSILDEVLKEPTLRDIAKLHYVSGFSVPKIAILKRMSREKVEELLSEARNILIPYLTSK